VFDVLFSLNRSSNVLVAFRVDQPRKMVTFGAAVIEAGTMFPAPPDNIGCYANVQRTEGSACHDINPPTAHSYELHGKWLTKGQRMCVDGREVRAVSDARVKPGHAGEVRRAEARPGHARPGHDGEVRCEEVVTPHVWELISPHRPVISPDG